MLSYGLLKNNAGIILTGDHHSLRCLHSALGDVNERSPVISDKEGALMEFAYEIRHALQGDREVFEASELSPEVGIRYGVPFIWPALLGYSRLLRGGMAFFDSTKWHQALAFNLEALVDDALTEAFEKDAAVLKERWLKLDAAHPWLEEKLNSRCAIFCSWGKEERFRRLPGLIASLDPMYDLMYQAWTNSGDTSVLAPKYLDGWHEVPWADPQG